MEAKIKMFLEITHGNSSGDGNGDGSGYGYGTGYGTGSGYGSGDVTVEGTGSGYGDGFGYGYGTGYGDGDGNGSGSGYGTGDGTGDGSVSGSGNGTGSGSGNGTGYGTGYGNGTGDGSGHGSGYGYSSGSGDGSGTKFLLELNGSKVYNIDDTPTIISSIKGNLASGYILKDDFSTTPCYIARVGNSFAHGASVKKAFKDAQNKHLALLSDDDKIKIFTVKFPNLNIRYKASIFYELHNILTGSCELGRKNFMSNKGIKMTDLFTPLEFLELTKNEYNNTIINLILTSIKNK